MRKASIRDNHVHFEERLKQMETLLHGLTEGVATLDESDANILFEAFALQLASYWEEVVDEDLVDALNRDTTQYADHIEIKLPKNLSRDICLGLLLGDRYFDFKSPDDLVARSKRLIVAANNPFIHIPKKEKKLMADFFILRNYLAHRSRVAERSYAKMLAGNDLARTMKPGKFLRAKQVIGTKKVRRFFVFLNAFQKTSKTIRKKSSF